MMARWLFYLLDPNLFEWKSTENNHARSSTVSSRLEKLSMYSTWAQYAVLLIENMDTYDFFPRSCMQPRGRKVMVTPSHGM